jgi:hypothetical protein
LGKQRKDITNQKIRDLYAKHGNKTLVAQALDCSQRLVHDALNGLRKDCEELVLTMDPKYLCTCCGIREKSEGLRFLCIDCYQDSSNVESNPCHINSL